MVFGGCRATIGQVGNIDHENVSLGKAGRMRHQGRRGHVRGVVMNPLTIRMVVVKAGVRSDAKKVRPPHGANRHWGKRPAITNAPIEQSSSVAG